MPLGRSEIEMAPIEMSGLATPARDRDEEARKVAPDGLIEPLSRAPQPRQLSERNMLACLRRLWAARTGDFRAWIRRDVSGVLRPIEES